MRHFQLISMAAICCLNLSAQVPKITIDQGYLSKNPTIGSKAHIWAQQNISTRVFAGWTGDVQYLLDPQAPYTTFTVPNIDVNLKATYRTLPAWTVRLATLNNIPVSYYVPPDPIGMVFLFHGTGGTGAGLFTASEFLSFARDMVAAGFAVAAFDCLNRDTAQWNTTVTGPSNPDIARLNGIIAAMRTQSIIPATLPLLAFGHSNGGFFSHFSSVEMKWAGVSISAVQGSTPASLGYNGPVVWWMPKNDDHPMVGLIGGIATSVARYEQIANRGLHARHTIQEAMPLFPERFARSQYLTMADSLEVFGIFKAKNWIDDNNFLVQNPNDFDWRSSLPTRYTETMRLAVSGQLEGTHMTHEFTNFTPNITLDLFLRGLGRKPAVRPISGASFAGTSVAANSIATVFSNALAADLEVAANGPQANLQGVNAMLRSAAGIETPVPWFFVSPGQGSFLVPSGAVAGNATLKIQNGDHRVAFPMSITATSPGIFAANGNGQGAPAAVILRVKPDNTRSTEFPFVAGSSGYDAAPIRFGDDRLFLDFYATGVRGSNSVQVLLGGETITPLYAGAQPQFVGLDQVTIELPKSFAGRGRLEATIISGGARSNTVELAFPN